MSASVKEGFQSLFCGCGQDLEKVRIRMRTALLERVFLRIGSAESDEQLENGLSKFLCPVLLKLDSKGDGVQKKVMELLVHVNKRVKSRPKLQLPMAALLDQYASTDISSFVKNFTIIYIKLGFPRLEGAKQVELIPTLLSCYSGRPVPHQLSLLQLVMPCFQYIKPPSGSRIKTDVLGVGNDPSMVKVMMNFMMNVLLLPYNFASYQSKQAASRVPSARAEAEQNASNGGAGTAAAEAKFTGPPPGLSESTFKRVVGENAPTPDELEKIKIGVIDVLASETFNEQDIFCQLVVASADSRHGVSSAADKEMKRTTGSPDWNNPATITKLYSVFQGTVLVKTQAASMKPEEKRAPSSVQMRLKIFPYFLKSREACNQFPACVQVVFDCLYGANTNAKLKNMAVQFIHHLCLNCPDVKFKPIAGVLLNGMRKLIGESGDDSKLRSLAYVAIGKISRRVPAVVGKDVALLQSFFDAICKEDAENRLAVQESLSMMSEAFSYVDENGLRQVEALIMQNIDKEENQARLMAVQYAHAVFPADHILSRYVLLLACGDNKDDVQTEASKFLRAPFKSESEASHRSVPPSPKKAKSRLLPTFADMMAYIQLKGSQRIKTQNRYVSGNSVLPFNPVTYTETVLYLRLCLCYDAGIAIDEESLGNFQNQAPRLALHVANMLSTEVDTDSDGKNGGGPLGEYIEMIRKLLNVTSNESCMYCLLEIAAVARERLAQKFAKHLDWVKNLMFSSREEMRVSAAEMYALTVVYGETSDRQNEILKDLTQYLTTQAYEGQHGSALCLGHLIGYLKSKDTLHVDDMETDQNGTNLDTEDAIKQAVIKIVELLDSSQVSLCLAGCTAVGEIGRKCALPLCDTADEGLSKLSLVENLLEKVNSDKTHTKLREKAATALGFLCLGENQFPHRKTVIEGLLKCAGPKQFELHMTVGEALVCAALGSSSPSARDHWLVLQEDFKATASEDVTEVQTLLDLLLKKYVCSLNPHIKQAACIWLLAVVKNCGTVSVIQAQLLHVQSAFMGLLTENDEMTQDIASKGLGVVYEKCSAEQKKELVSVLVDTLTTGKKRAQTVTGDTKLFEDGALGKTPDGKNLSTYRELCSIANDLNQPDLIYKFMHLANHNAIWNSKKGAAFGFGSIAAQAGEQLAPYLHKIIPKLYRYQFDPNPKIQQAMSSIWAALVPETKKTVDKYQREILEDLMQNLTSTQWRVRESSCIALNDLLRGRHLDEVVEHLPRVWEIMFRVRDDIKESVRKAADSACKSLSRASIKICDPEYGKIGEQATSLVLPCLLNVGLGNTVEEVRALSLATILKISKSAGKLLKPHISQLVGALLESLSTLEPQYLNYLSLHVAGSQQTTEKLDNARIAASKTSPMMEVINLCIPFIDESVMSELVPRLVELLRSGISIGTKAGCASFIVSLTHQCPSLLTPHAGKLLGVLLNGLNDRNSTVKKTFGSTIGNLVKVAKDSSVEKLILRLKEWYFEKEDESVRRACGITLQAIARRSPDVLKRHSATALPLAFLAMHQKDPVDESSSEKMSSVWQEVWLDTTPGTEAGVRLYLKELVSLSQFALESQAWGMKGQGAASMQTIASKLGSSLGPPHLGIVLQALLAGLSGRTWTGKESLLQALSSVCVSCKDKVSDCDETQQPSLSTITQAVLKECRKENLKYKTEAFKCLGEILNAHEELDLFKELADLLFPVLDKKKEADEDQDKDSWLQFEEVAYETLGQAWPTSHSTQETYHREFHSLLVAALRSSVWRVEVAVLKTYRLYLNKIWYLQDSKSSADAKDAIHAVITDLVPRLCTSLGNVKYTSIRSESMTVLETLCDKLKGCGQLSVLQTQNPLELLVSALKARSTDSEPGLGDRAQTLIKLLQQT